MRLLAAVAASVALVLAGPAIGQLRSSLLAAFPSSYRLILLAVVLAVTSIAAAVAVVRIRERRALRYGCLGAAFVIAAAYSWNTRTGDASVDAVERFHFVEYGLVTLLFYRAWRPAGDGSLLVLPVLAALVVGICEEWLQWFVPARVGEVRDVVLNLWAIGCGMLFSVALDPPPRLTLSMPGASWLRVRHVAAVALIVFALFFHTVHLGYRVDDGEGGTFPSYYTGAVLAEHSRVRADEWRTNPPMTWSRYSREDQYFSEGIVHVRARNRCWDQGDLKCAWRETRFWSGIMRRWSIRRRTFPPPATAGPTSSAATPGGGSPTHRATPLASPTRASFTRGPSSSSGSRSR